MQKLYCYVDENGMETRGRVFVVAIVVLDSDPQTISAYCEALERDSGKGKFKWGKAEQKKRLDYLNRALKSPELSGRLCYAIFRDMKAYEAATIEAIARAIRHFGSGGQYRARIYVDALAKSKRHPYGAQLRNLGVSPYKVQGVTKDENNSLVRLADAVAGFVRDAFDGDSDEIRDLFRQAESSGALLEV